MTMKNLLENFRRYVKEEEIEEATRASKEGVTLPSVVEQLEKYVVSDDEMPTHFVQFSKINKLGINPSSKFNTPMGIYSYPLVESLFKQYKRGQLPFASDREYVIVFKVKPGSKILAAGVGEPLSKEDFTSMAKLLFSKKAANLAKNPRFYESKLDSNGQEEYTPEWGRMSQDARNQSSLGKLWYGSMMLAKDFSSGSKKSPKSGMRIWRTVFQKLWGIDGVVDMGSIGSSRSDVPVIHPAEPTQAVFFSKSAIEHVTTLRNTETPEAIERRKRNRKRVIYDLINRMVRKEWDELYDGIAVGFATNAHQRQHFLTNKEKLLGGKHLHYRVFPYAKNALGSGNEHDPSWWRDLTGITLDELADKSKDPTGLRGYMSAQTFERWLIPVHALIRKKVYQIYRIVVTDPIHSSRLDRRTLNSIGNDLRTWLDIIVDAIDRKDITKEKLSSSIKKVIEFHDNVENMRLSAISLKGVEESIRIAEAAKIENAMNILLRKSATIVSKDSS